MKTFYFLVGFILFFALPTWLALTLLSFIFYDIWREEKIKKEINQVRNEIIEIKKHYNIT